MAAGFHKIRFPRFSAENQRILTCCLLPSGYSLPQAIVFIFSVVLLFSVTTAEHHPFFSGCTVALLHVQEIFCMYNFTMKEVSIWA